MRTHQRGSNALRPVKITRQFNKYAEGSVLIEIGDTRVICTVSLDEKVPPFQKNTGQGWLTAEYSMLPRSTHTRTARERNYPGGRTQEIQRLIGRSLRSVIDMSCFPERTLLIDCDVIQADGGTRIASITGGFVALVDACHQLKANGKIDKFPIHANLAAVSVGKVKGEIYLDLDYEEDSKAQVDMNVVALGDGRLIEVQATAEAAPLQKNEMDQMVELALFGIQELQKIQRQSLGDALWAMIANP